MSYDNIENQAENLYNQGIKYLQLGNYGGASDCFLQAAQLFESCGKTDKANDARAKYEEAGNSRKIIP
jgi:outer membrane protein assembly factor BamD (BamD/ComL family)